MIEQALKFVQDLSVKGVAAKITKNTGHSIQVEVSGEGLRFHSIAPDTPHRHMYSLKDLVAYVAMRSGFRSEGKRLTDSLLPLDSRAYLSCPFDVPSEGSVVFYDDSRVEYLESPHDARGIRVCMELSYTPEFTLVKNCEWMNQAAFYRMLKIDLDGLIASDNLIKSVSKVRFENGQVTAGNIAGTGRSTVSKEIKSEANSDVAVPDEVLILIKPYEQLDHTAAIRVAVEVDAKKELFKLTPYPQVMSKLTDDALDTVADALMDTGIPVFYGTAPGELVMQ